MRFKRFFSIHMILLLVAVITVCGLLYRFFHWGQLVNLEEIFKDSEEAEYRGEYLDLFLPVMDKDGNIVPIDKEVSTIVCFGNAPFADDRDSEDNLANIIARKTGATVYNCSISGSYLSAEAFHPDVSEHPIDAYNFYWLTHLTCKNAVYERCAIAAEALGDAAPPEAQEVFDTLWNLDFNDVDVVVIMYDASDYLAGRPMYDDSYNKHLECFTGNLEAGIEVLLDAFPHLRIIVMSPTYAYGIDEEGNYVSSDIQTYGWDVLSTYVIKEYESCHARNVTFIDNLYGTITSENAKDYLIDNLHLNVAGRELVADRFCTALHYFD